MIAFILKIWTFVKKYLKWILAAVALAVIIIVGSVAGGKGQRLKEADAQIQALLRQVDTQQELIIRLAAMESVHCEVSLTVKNTAVMGANHSGAVTQEAEQIATYLRGEILEKLMEDAKPPITEKRGQQAAPTKP